MLFRSVEDEHFQQDHLGLSVVLGVWCLVWFLSRANVPTSEMVEKINRQESEFYATKVGDNGRSIRRFGSLVCVGWFEEIPG